jgi:hypothetical protein
MVIKVNDPLFAQRQEILVNYDYFDVADGVGYQIYYGAKGDNGEYIVTTTNQIHSEELKTATETQSIATSFTKYIDMDFDLTFNTPRNIKGDVLMSVPIGIAAESAVLQGFEFYCVGKVVHYDGSTETTLATGTSRTISVSIETDGKSYACINALLKANVSTMQHFKVGEILRFTIEGWYKTTEGSATDASIGIGHDPTDRDDTINWTPHNAEKFTVLANEGSGGGTLTYMGSRMEFHVPFKLDI